MLAPLAAYAALRMHPATYAPSLKIVKLATVPVLSLLDKFTPAYTHHPLL